MPFYTRSKSKMWKWGLFGHRCVWRISQRTVIGWNWKELQRSPRPCEVLRWRRQRHDSRCSGRAWPAAWWHFWGLWHWPELLDKPVIRIRWHWLLLGVQNVIAASIFKGPWSRTRLLRSSCYSRTHCGRPVTFQCVVALVCSRLHGGNLCF